MNSRRNLVVAKAMVILGTIPLLIWAHAAGPDLGKSGVPGESTCLEAGCHTGTSLNGGGGSVKVTFPDGLSYTPGGKQHLVVTVSDPAQRMWGFQVTARLSSNTRSQAGTFRSTDRLTAVVCGASPTDANEVFLDFGQNQTCAASLPFTYIEHTLAGSSRLQFGSQTYEFDWTPPTTDVGNINVYVAGNAANASGSETGDHIYTASFTLSPSAPGPPPAILPSGVVSAGAFGGFPAIAPGSWVEIYGTGLSSTMRSWAGSDFNGVSAPTVLDGVKVTIGAQAAFVDYVSPGQVNAQAPSNLSAGTAQMTVTNSNGTSAAYNIVVNALQPGLLATGAFQASGKQYVVAQFPDGTYVLPPNTIAGVPSRQAKPGETIIIYGVGFGPAASSGGSITAGQIVQAANQLTNPLQLQFGGVTATLGYFGLAPNFVGLYQFNVVVPAVPNNDFVPLTFTLNGAAGSQVLYTAVHN
jgi:uncharacterized protein (TIGR03437 family)